MIQFWKQGFSIKSASWLLASAISLAVTGCGESAKPWEVVVPVKGTVTYRGKPVAGAQISLYPANAEFPSSVIPSATSVQNGEFSVGTYGTDDGAPAGEYRVAIVWHPLVDKGSGGSRGDNVLPPKLANPETSGLKVVVNSEETTLPSFNL